MIAYSTSSGGVLFVSDDAHQENGAPLSYSEFLEQQDAVEKSRIFGKKKSLVCDGASSDEIAQA